MDKRSEQTIFMIFLFFVFMYLILVHARGGTLSAGGVAQEIVSQDMISADGLPETLSVDDLPHTVPQDPVASPEPADPLGIPRLVNTSSASYDSIQVTWEAVPDAQGYEVYRMENSKWELLGDTERVSYTDSFHVLTGSRYTYTVRAYRYIDGKKICGDHDEAGITGRAVLSVPHIQKIEAVRYDCLKIFWQKTAGADGHQILRKENGRWKAVAMIKGDKAPRYTHKDSQSSPVKTGVPYIYTIKAYRVVDGKRVWSAYDQNGSIGQTAPGTTKITQACAVSASSVKLVWKRAKGASGYVIERSQYKDTGYRPVGRVKKLSYTDKKLAREKNYHYRIQPFCRVNGKRVYGPYSDIQRASTKISAASRDILRSMGLEQKVAQMFFVTPEALAGPSASTHFDSRTREAFADLPVGGIILMGDNIVTKEQVIGMLGSYQDVSETVTGLPVFTGVDEEGGRVARIAGRGIISTPVYPSMLSIGKTKDPSAARDAGYKIGSYIKRLGFNVDFAPVADVWTNPADQVIGDRAFGSDPDLVAKMVAAQIKGFHKSGVLTSVKHFPGHGDTSEDSHSGMACTYKTLEGLERCELIPFQTGFDAGADLVMMGHISCPGILSDNTPASLSRAMCTGLVKKKMGFKGLLITDSMGMGAITKRYTTETAAIKAVKAGEDMLLMSADLDTAYKAVLQAVKKGKIKEARIDQSVRKIISKKLQIKWGCI